MILRRWGPRPIYHNTIPRRRPATCAQKSLWGAPHKVYRLSPHPIVAPNFISKKCFCWKCKLAVLVSRNAGDPCTRPCGACRRRTRIGDQTGCGWEKADQNWVLELPQETTEMCVWSTRKSGVCCLGSNYKQVMRRSRDVKAVRIDERRANGA